MSEAVEHLDARGRVTVKLPFRDRLRDGYIQVLTPDGVLFYSVKGRKLKSKGSALADVDDEAAKDL